jgi:hypothetical protein
MAELDQGAHLCVPLLPQIDTAELLPLFGIQRSQTPFSYFITFDTVGRYALAGLSIFVQPELTKFLHFRDMR